MGRAARAVAQSYHAVMANELELFYWWFHDDVTGQRLRTAYAMDRATATALYGNVQPDEPTRVVRVVYELGDRSMAAPKHSIVERGV